MVERQETLVATKRQSGVHFTPEEFNSDTRFTELSRASTDTVEVRRPPPDGRVLPSDVASSSSSIPALPSNAVKRRPAANEPESTRKRLWSSLGNVFSRRRNRSNSISEAELEAAETRTSLLAVDESGSPTQLPSPFAIFRRSFTLPSKLNPDHLDRGHLDPDQRTSSAEDSDYPLSPFVAVKDDLVFELQRQLDERDEKMREIRQEAMTSVCQLQQLTSVVMEMKAELDSLKAENDRLQRLVRQDTPDTFSSSASAPSKTDVWGNLVHTSNSNGIRDGRRADQTNPAASAAAAKPSASSADGGRINISGSSRLQVIKQHV